MIWYYFKTAIKSLENNKKFSGINIAGFAFGISVCLAISLFLIKEYSFDRYHEHARQIVRLVDTKNNSSAIDYRVKDILAGNYPEIENACLVQRISYPIAIKKDNKGYFLDDIMSVDNQFFKVFTVPFISGNASTPFCNVNSAVITESAAKSIFGTEDPLGKDLQVWGNVPVTITGIIKDFSEISSISAGLLVNAENEKFKFSQWIGNGNDLSTYRWPFQIYFQLRKDINEELLANKINSNSQLLKPYNEAIGFLKLKDIYLHDTTIGSETKRGNIVLLRLLSGIALIILTLAVINYINLTVAQQSKRNKESGVRKINGANRSNILLHFIFESVIVSFLSFVLAILLLMVLNPFYDSILDTKLSIGLLFNFPYNFILLVSVLLIGIISGSGPAVLLSCANPVKVLSSNLNNGDKKKCSRNLLTVFQFTISIILIFCVMIVLRQIQYVKHKDPGFNEEQLVCLDLPEIQGNDLQKTTVLMDEFRKSPFIKGISVSCGVPGKIPMSMGSNIENTDKNMDVPCLLVDTAFIKTFGLKVIKGRNLEPGDYGKVCMINESAYKHFEFENLQNKRFNNYGGFDIIAVVNDFQYSSLHNTIGPVFILFKSNDWPTSIVIRFEGNRVIEGMDYIQKTWLKIWPEYPIKYQFYDDWYDSMYRSEERLAKIIGFFSILAIVISCIGILGLAIFASERRTKEIGVRKINGAKVSEILNMLNRDFVKWVAIAFVIATPIAWYAMHTWLENFAYKTELNWWIFALAGLLALGIALLTVSWQSWKAATRNPVEALRYE